MKKIRYTISALFCVLGILSCNAPDNVRTISIVPAPQRVQQYIESENFVISRDCRIVIPDCSEELLRTVALFNERLNIAAGFQLEVVKEHSGGPAIWFMDAGLPHEAYSIKVSDSQVIVDYGDGAGAFYAMQTLLQLLPSEIFSPVKVRGVRWDMPACDIEDEPRFGYRGMHLDVCLHYFDIDFLKKYIDLMAMHKINVFHWHLTEDQGWRLEISRYPLLTEKGQWRKETVIGSYKSGFYDGKPYGGYYTQEQVRDLVRYASERYVTIVPEIEMPGHALAAIACYPELSCGLEENYEVATRWGIFRQVYCPKESTFEFLKNVLDEVFEMFPSKIIHIGGDECPKTSWKKCPDCQRLIKKLGLKDEYELQSWFIKQIDAYVSSKGREIIGWDEILQGGLAPGAKVMSWLGEEGGIKAARQHHEVVMAPYPKYYLDYWQADPESEPMAMDGPTTLRTMYEYEPVPEVLTPEESKYIIGVEGCVWTEYMPTEERVEYMAYPRMAAIAESAWTRPAFKDYDSFTRRLEVHFERYDGIGLSYCKAFYNPFIRLHPDGKYDRIVTMELDAPDAQIRYTLDGSDPTAQSELYELPFVLTPQQTVRAAAFRDGRQIGKTMFKSFK